MAGERATITAVARHVGVSVSTVSRVMNGNPTVAPDLVQRVRAAAEELGYTASPMARSLVLGRTQTVAVVVPDLGNPMFQGILRGVARAADAEGYHVLVADTGEDAAAEPETARRARERCDAVVLVSPRMSEETLADLAARLAPVVVVNRWSPRVNAPSLGPDYRAGITVLADHLAQLGHRRIAYLSGRPGSFSDDERRAGLAAAAASAGLEILALPGGVMHDDGVAAADRVLASGATAVLAFNDLVAMGLLSALHSRGVRVPEEISVAGFDDIPLAAFTTPSLTTASLPVAQIGAETWARLSRLLERSEVAGDVTFRPRLVVRDSTGPAPEPSRDETRQERPGAPADAPADEPPDQPSHQPSHQPLPRNR